MFDNIDDMISKDKKELKEGAEIGRPKTKAKDRKEHRVVAYLTEAEQWQLAKLADAEMYTLSQMARKLIVLALKSKK